MYSSIVVGTDGSPTARVAVQHAASLAKLCGAPLHVVSAYRLAAQVMLTGPMGEGLLAGAGAGSDAEAAAEVESLLGEIAAGLEGDGISVATHARAMGAAEAILDIAQKQHADLIVVGNRGMKGARRVLGSVPNTLSHKAQCSVLIVNSGPTPE